MPGALPTITTARVSSVSTSGSPNGSVTVNTAPGARSPLVHLDRAAMQRHQLLHQREPDPRSRLGARERLVHLIEALEDVRQMLGRECRGRCRPRGASRHRSVSRSVT